MDTLFENGAVLTLEDGARTAEALLVRDGRIVLAGTREEAGQLAGFLPRPRQDDPAVPHQQGLSCARAVLQGQHRAVFKQGVHTHPPVCLRVSVSVCPITRIAPAGRLCQLLEVPGGLQAAKHPGR